LIRKALLWKKGNQGPPPMPFDFERRCVLIAAAPVEAPVLRQPFAAGRVPGWEARTADTFERALFLLQHDVCDALLLDETLSGGDGGNGLIWLANQREAPVLFLSAPVPGTITAALERGAAGWLPRELVPAHPDLLAAALNQAARLGQLRGRTRHAEQALLDCRRQVSRFVDLVWEITPADPHTGWLPQRHMMERLDEEAARSSRHGLPFSVVLGELAARDEQLAAAEPLSAWAIERISRAKRRCDVAGQYGPHGFMLLLANTAETGAVTCCRRLQAALERGSSGGPLPVAVAFGVATGLGENASPKNLLRRAEESLEQARTTGAGQD
jgi:diguanylate cyclase (GGDEF)-like protein